MSKKEAQSTEQAPEKVMTKYDLKMQRRKEEKERERKSRRNGNIMGIVIVVALVCIVASFPIRNYLTVNGTYVTVDGEKISRVEFDYNYNVAVNSYLSQYGYYLYMMGIDPSSDLTSQMYTDKLTWGDFFEQLAVENIARNKGMLREAKAEGFSYDTSEDYREFEESLAQAATDNGSTEKAYVKELYGVYATSARLKPFIEESMYVGAYYDVVAERMTPAQEEIQEYYDNNKASYDSVDYYMLTVDAQLPTEPTELADPVEEPEEGETEGEAAEGEEDAEEPEPYQPSEAEIEAAMKEAKTEADKAEKNVKTEGELRENAKQSAVSSLIRDWLFDEERKAGDTTVIEDANNHRYYVVGFENRYLDETLSVDLRMAMTTEDNGQAILDEWQGGAATEESFAEICDKYNDPSITAAEGGLLEGVTSSSMPEEIGSWLHDPERTKGDTTVISPEGEEYTYVLYYVGTNDAEWVLSIRQTLLGEKMAEYMNAFTESIDVKDPKKNLYYLEVQAEEAAAAESAAQESGEENAGDEGAESSENVESSEGTDSSEGAESSEETESQGESEAE